MSMRPSLRLVRIPGSPPLGTIILRSNARSGKAGLAGPAGPPTGAGPHRPATRPAHLDQLARQRRRELALGRVIHRVDPLDLGLAELARAVTLVERIEHAALAHRAILDVGIARERSDRNAIAA